MLSLPLLSLAGSCSCTWTNGGTRCSGTGDGSACWTQCCGAHLTTQHSSHGNDAAIVASKRINSHVVGRGEVVVDLTQADLALRYFTLIDGWLFGRSQPRGGWTQHTDFRSHAMRMTRTPTTHMVLTDVAMAGTLGLAKIGGQLIAIGGEWFRPPTDKLSDNMGHDERDGMYMVPFGSVTAAVEHSWHSDWETCCHGTFRRDHPAVAPRLFDGMHPGCMSAFDRWRTDAYTNVRTHCKGNMRAGLRGGPNDCGCKYDTKTSFLLWKGKVILWLRANVHSSGGRYVQVTSSHSDDPKGPYGALELIHIEGYDYNGPGNLYMFVVNENPVDTETLLALFPLNEGQAHKGNGDGESYIAMTLSCDGVHWSRLTKLVWTTGKGGRTYDHPIDGFTVSGSDIHFYMHLGVDAIDPDARERGRIVKYAFNTTALREVTAAARRDLSTCPQQAHAPPPPSLSPSPPPSPRSPSPSPPPKPSPPPHRPHCPVLPSPAPSPPNLTLHPPQTPPSPASSPPPSQLPSRSSSSSEASETVQRSSAEDPIPGMGEGAAPGDVIGAVALLLVAAGLLGAILLASRRSWVHQVHRRNGERIGPGSQETEGAKHGVELSSDARIVALYTSPPRRKNGGKEGPKLTVSELNRRARSKGVPASQIEAAMESDEPRAALATLIQLEARKRRLLGRRRTSRHKGRAAAGDEADGVSEDSDGL